MHSAWTLEDKGKKNNDDDVAFVCCKLEDGKRGCAGNTGILK